VAARYFSCLPMLLSKQEPIDSNHSHTTIVAEAVVLGGYRSRLIINGQEDTPIETAPGGVIITRDN